MQVLTPSGYRDILDCEIGDEVCAFDMVTGDPVVNVIESKTWVDAAEWARWHNWTDVPPFEFVRINDTWTLNSEQSIWRNGVEVCHAKHLQVGDEIYDDTDQPCVITSVEPVEEIGWWRLDISGDHSYIVDGLTVHNASRFWVGGTGTWDRTTTTHWASSSNGASGASAPGSADTATLDGSSGGGTVTVTWDTGTVVAQSIACGAFTGTLDFSASNNNVTLSANGGFSGSGSGARTINLGNGTWSLTATAGGATPWTIATTTGLTFNANSSVIDFTGTVAAGSGQTFSGGALTYSTLKISGARFNSGLVIINSAGTFGTLNVAAAATVSFSAGATITTLTVGAQLTLSVAANTTLTLTNAPTFTGSSSAPNAIVNGSVTATVTTATITCASGTVSGTYCSIQGCTFSGGATFSFTNSNDLGRNSGATITAPSSGGRAIQVNNPSLVS